MRKLLPLCQHVIVYCSGGNCLEPHICSSRSLTQFMYHIVRCYQLSSGFSLPRYTRKADNTNNNFNHAIIQIPKMEKDASSAPNECILRTSPGGTERLYTRSSHTTLFFVLQIRLLPSAHIYAILRHEICGHESICPPEAIQKAARSAS